MLPFSPISQELDHPPLELTVSLLSYVRVYSLEPMRILQQFRPIVAGCIRVEPEPILKATDILLTVDCMSAGDHHQNSEVVEILSDEWLMFLFAVCDVPIEGHVSSHPRVPHGPRIHHIGTL